MPVSTIIGQTDMSIQKRNSVLKRTKQSFDSDYVGCKTLAAELAIKELVAYEGENYCEAFVLQFSFIEQSIERAIVRYSELTDVHPTSLALIRRVWKVSDKITIFDCLLSSRIDTSSRKEFKRLIGALREYNSFRNDFLHDCANSKKFSGAIHIDQALVEAYNEGLEIMKLFSGIKLDEAAR